MTEPTLIHALADTARLLAAPDAGPETLEAALTDVSQRTGVRITLAEDGALAFGWPGEGDPQLRAAFEQALIELVNLARGAFGRPGGILDRDSFLHELERCASAARWRDKQLALCVFLLAAAVITVALARRYRVIENSLLWTLAASFIALRAGGASHLAAAYFAAAGLVLAVAVLETSYNMAYQDELTRLPSRRALNEALLKLGDSYSIAMVDVDHFKKFNDTYGHAAGDEALRMVASRLAHVTGGGKAYRYGGEEFAVLFPNKPAEEAFTYLDGMRRLISQSTFVVRGRDRRKRGGKKPPSKVETKVTVSVGIAARNGEKFSIEEVLRCADKALYKAKARGRNCTVTGKPAKSAAAITTTMRVLQVE